MIIPITLDFETQNFSAKLIRIVKTLEQTSKILVVTTPKMKFSIKFSSVNEEIHIY